CRHLSPARSLFGEDSQGREPGGASGLPIHKNRADHQSQDCEAAWSLISDCGAGPRRRGDRVKRREFITLLGGAAAAWPLAARAQQPERVRRVGVLMSTSQDNPEGQARIAAFLQGLQQLGWTDGRNIRIDTRWGADDRRKSAKELVALAPDVILASTGSTVAALQQATRTVPIVFSITLDPVGSGFVASLARPGGNTTGFMQFEYSLSGKWLELL